MTLTQNYGFSTPERTDRYTISDQNQNWIKADTEIKKNADVAAAAKEKADSAVPSTSVGAAGGVAPLDANKLIFPTNLPAATSASKGAVKLGSGFIVGGGGEVSATPASVGAETPAGAQAKVDAHAADKNNPHGVTTAQIGAAPAVHSHTAAQVSIADVGNHFVATDVEGALQEVFTSVVDGKAAVATAISAKRGTVAGTAPHSFQELVDGIGTIRLGTGNAQPGDVLNGKTFSNDDGPDKIGTMPNNGAVTITPAMADVAIPAGYHNGQGRVLGGNYRVGGLIDYTALGMSKPPVGEIVQYATTVDCMGIVTDSSGFVYTMLGGTLYKYSPFGENVVISAPNMGTASVPVMTADDRLFLIDANVIHRIDTTTLAKTASYTTDITPLSSYFDSCDVVGNFVYILGGGRIQKRSLTDGTLVWDRVFTNGRQIAVAPNGTYYLARNYYTDGYTTGVYDEATGTKLFNKDAGNSTYSVGALAISPDSAYYWIDSALYRRSDNSLVVRPASPAGATSTTPTWCRRARYLPDGNLLVAGDEVGGSICLMNGTSGQYIWKIFSVMGELYTGAPTYGWITTNHLAVDFANKVYYVGGDALKKIQEKFKIKG